MPKRMRICTSMICRHVSHGLTLKGKRCYQCGKPTQEAKHIPLVMLQSIENRRFK